MTVIFPTDEGALVDVLVAKDSWKAIDSARVIRNSRAHGGVRSQAEIAASLEQLRSLLVDLRAILGEAFETVELVRPGPSHFEDQTFRHEAAERLTGPVDIFLKRRLMSAMPLEANRLYVVPRDAFVTNALRLLPLFKLHTPVETEENAVYFFSGKRPDGRFDFVSYHFPTRSQRCSRMPSSASSSRTSARPPPRRTALPRGASGAGARCRATPTAGTVRNRGADRSNPRDQRPRAHIHPV